jgi:hypothetical protein
LVLRNQKLALTIQSLWHVSFVPVHADVDGWRGRHSFKLVKRPGFDVVERPLLSLCRATMRDQE